MYFNLDRAVFNDDEDKLGRASFAKKLAQAIYEHKGTDSYVIGIYGKWGTSKTTTANIVLNSIINLSKNTNTLVINFNPWNYLGNDDLFSRFFDAFEIELYKGKIKIDKEKISGALRKYASVVNILSVLPVYGEAFAEGTKSIAQGLAEQLENRDLEKSKNELKNQLEESKIKTVVLIDDIDRLTNKQILDVFQLVKQVGDLPNITYILSMDKDIVVNALSEIHNIDGNEYLEKIVQIPFELPRINKSKVIEIFNDELYKVIKEIDGGIMYDEYYMYRILYNCVYPCINTLRDVHRIINVFRFKYTLLHKNVSVEDLIAITTIEVVIPELYYWISNNKEALCKGEVKHDHVTSGEEALKSYIKTSLEGLKLDMDYAYEVLYTLFPKIQTLSMNYYPSLHENDRYRMRISRQERFDYIFSFDYDTLIIPREIVEDIIYKKNTKSIKKLLLSYDCDDLRYLFDEILLVFGDISGDRVDIVMSAIYDLYFSKNELSVHEGDVYALYHEYIFKFLNTRIHKIEIVREFIKIVSYKTIDGILLLANLADESSFSNIIYSNLTSMNKTDPLYTPMCKLKDLYLEKIRLIENKDVFLHNEYCFNILRLWEHFDADSYDNYLDNLFSSGNLYKLKFLCRCSSMWEVIDRREWKFFDKKYNKYFSNDELYSLLMESPANILLKFSRREQEALVAFIISYDKNVYHVGSNVLDNVLKEWSIIKEVEPRKIKNFDYENLLLEK